MAQDRQLQSEREIVRVGLIGQDYYRKTANSQHADQAFINCYPEIYRNPTTGEERHVITKFPKVSIGSIDIPGDLNTALGLTTTNLTCVAHMALVQLDGLFISIWVDVSTGIAYVYQNDISTGKVQIGSIAKLGALSASLSAHDCFSIQEVQIANGGTIYAGITINRTAYDLSLSSGWYARATATTFTAGSLNQIVSAAYPDQLGTPLVCTGPIIQLNGIFHVLTTSGVIYSSNGGTGTPNDPTNWASTAVIQCYQEADRGVALARYKHHILAFSSNSVEFFNDIGNPAPASPLERTEQAFIKFGALTPKQIINVADSIYWISWGRHNTVGLWRLDGYTPVKVSSAAQDSVLYSSAQGGASYLLGDINIFAFSLAGKTHVGINGISYFPMVYHSDSSLRWGTSLDTYYTENYHLRYNMVCGVMLYNVEDKTWWFMMIAPGDGSGIGTRGNTYGILPASFTGNPSNTMFYTNYTQVYFTINKPSTALTSTFRRYVYKIPSPGDGSIWGMAGGDRTWPVIIQWNTLTFGNLNRKRVINAELVFANVPTSHSVIEYITLTWDKSNHPTEVSGASDLVSTLHGARTMKEPEETSGVYQSPSGSLGIMGWPDRYFVNNLGMGRFWNFYVIAATQGAFDLEALDLTVSQCTS